MAAIQQVLLMGGGAGTTVATWDPNPAYVGANWALSNVNRTGTNTSTPSLSSSENLRSTNTNNDKRYFEAQFTVVPSSQQLMLGIMTAAKAVNTKLGFDTISIAYDSLGLLTYNSGNAGPYITVSAGDVVMVAYDATNGKFWAGVNNTWANSGNPAAGTGNLGTGPTGYVHAAAGVDIFNRNAELVGHFVTADFSYTPPSGFLGWGD